MGVVYLLRHGQASFGQLDYDRLSDLGVRQAELLGRELRRRGLVIDDLQCGSLRRQRGTADHMVAAAGLDIVPTVDARWDEYDHLSLVTPDGEDADASGATAAVGPLVGAEGVDRTDLAEMSRSFQGELDAALLRWSEELDDDLAADDTTDIYGPPPKQETWSAFHRRVRAALTDLIARQKRGSTSVVVTSGGVISAVCAQLLGMPPTGFIALNRVSVNGAVTKLVNGRLGTNLVSFNDHAYLELAGRDYVTYR